MSDETNIKLQHSLQSLENALLRLEEALQEPASNALAVDGTIQRFEFVIELFWKMLKRALRVEGIETKTPRESLIQAYQVGWLADENMWLRMLKDRNETSHLYSEETARVVYNRIHDDYALELRRVYELLKARHSVSQEGV